MTKKQITQKQAREKYGIVISKIQHHDKVKFYLLDNGNVVDHIGDIRYQAPIMTINKAIKMLKGEIKEEEKNAEESDEVWQCCDKALSEGVLSGLYTGLSYLKSIYDKKTNGKKTNRTR